MWVRVRMTWGVCVCIGVKSVMCVHETELEFHCCCCCCCYVHIYLLLFALFTWEWMAANEQESMYACVSEWMNMLLGCCSLYIRFTDLLELDCGRRNELAVPEIVCSLAGNRQNCTSFVSFESVLSTEHVLHTDTVLDTYKSKDTL